MERNDYQWLIKFSLGLLLPSLLLCLVIHMGKASEQNMVTTEPPAQEQTGNLTVLFGDEQRKMDLEDYLLGVVLAEMPASFEVEALKAQAVAARTYTIMQCRQGSKHGVNTVCTDYTCCQAYIAPQDYLYAGGTQASIDRVQQALTDTCTEVLTYQGELIYATYFSCAGDATEDAVAVWGQYYPYLQSVPSPGEENALFYTDTREFTPEQFQTALGVRLEGAAEQWFGQSSYTDGGGVDIMSINGVAYRGTTLRTLLGLRSTAFTVCVQNGQIIFQTKGYGHRVGMSQYGANVMAQNGKDYRQILTHYYTGTEIVHYTNEWMKNSKSFS